MSLTAVHSEDVPSKSYQGGSSSAEPVVEIPSDNFHPCPEFKVGTANQDSNQFLKQGLHIF